MSNEELRIKSFELASSIVSGNYHVDQIIKISEVIYNYLAKDNTSLSN